MPTTTEPDEPITIVDKRGQSKPKEPVPQGGVYGGAAPRARKSPELEETARLADLGREHLDKLAGMQGPASNHSPADVRPIITTHNRYGAPPGELRYIHSDDWTPEQTAVAVAWLKNEQAKDWWRAQGEAQRAA